ncbi:MAG: hypothetical protein NTU77_01910 [Actinobacteria bacterium]|nr:hypothetical protein [Actinomycetota bacterium]
MHHDGSSDGLLPHAVVISETEVTEALERVLTSGCFSRRPRSRDFLAFVVTESLAGRADSIKERTVARRALKRSETFDGRRDAIVRVQATRVRAALADYYDSEGADDPVRIALPAGTYTPVFDRADLAAGDGPGQRSSLGPGVVVIAFTDADAHGQGSARAIALTESLVHSLSRFPGLRVLGPVDRRPGRGEVTRRRHLGYRLDVAYVLEGTVVTSGSTVRVTVRVSDAVAGDIVWSGVFDRDADAFTGFSGHDDVVRHVAGLVGDYSGAIQRDALTRGVVTGNPAVYSAMQQFYAALETNTPMSAQEVRARLEAALVLEPRNPLVLAMLASVAAYLAGDGDPVDSAANWEQARQYAREALRIDPQSAHATLVLGRASRGTDGPDAAKRLLRRAIELAPANPSILYAAGTGLTEVDEWDEGIAFVRESARLNPDHPTYRYMYLAIDSMMSGDYAAALVESTIFDRRFEFWGPLLRGLTLDGLGHADEAGREIAAARELEPDLDLAVAGTTDLPVSVRDFLLTRLRSIGTADEDDHPTTPLR